ncbi:MAG: type II toxin-antitoxin system YafQ family toxin [Bacteroides sp.]|nr:type II toxin-antitoxin system YafQ family toxin [Bacteroides sp.]
MLISTTHQFRKYLKVAKKRGLDIVKFNEVVRLIAMQEALLTKNKDQKLSGDYSGCRKCYI